MTERAAYIGRVRALAKACCEAWLNGRARGAGRLLAGGAGRLHGRMTSSSNCSREEIPARMQAQAAKDLERLVVGALTDRGLLFEAARGFAGPRRLTLAIDGLAGEAARRDARRRKARASARREKAIEGFLKSAGVHARPMREAQTTPRASSMSR